MKRILVIRGGAIGDFILTLPALRLLRDAFPRVRLEILGYKHITALAENRFYADAVHSIEYGGLASFFAAGADLPGALCHFFGSFDLIVSYLFDPEVIFQTNLRRCGAESFLACSPKISGDGHAARQLARPLQQLGLNLADPAAKLFPSEADRHFARNNYPAHPAIAVHPGSGSEDKNWPLENWIALIEQLLIARAEASLLVLGGEADELRFKALRSLFPERVQFAETLALVNLAAVIEQSALFIGHDSGISHMAAAVGTPCILLFGPTDPKVWAPVNANARVVQSSTGMMDDISVDEILDAVGAVDESVPSTN